MTTMVHKCSRGTCFSLTGAPQCAHSKGDDDAVIRLRLDPADPADQLEAIRQAGTAYQQEWNASARQRYADAETGRRREAAYRYAMRVLLEPAKKAAGSYGSGAYTPLVQIARFGAGHVELPV